MTTLHRSKKLCGSKKENCLKGTSQHKIVNFLNLLYGVEPISSDTQESQAILIQFLVFYAPKVGNFVYGYPVEAIFYLISCIFSRTIYWCH